jgi:dynein heavy chain
MPPEDMPGLDSEQISRLIAMAGGGKLSTKVTTENNDLIHEVNLDFARTLNKIIFDKHMNENGKELISKNLHLPPPSPPKEIPF